MKVESRRRFLGNMAALAAFATGRPRLFAQQAALTSARTMDALKKSAERAGCTMDSILNLQIFLSTSRGSYPDADR